MVTSRFQILKRESIFLKRLGIAGIFVLVLFTSSCQENDVEATGMANVKVVNASPGSAAQRFFLVDKVLVNGGLEFTEATDYIRTNSGKLLIAEFKNQDDGNVTSKGGLYLSPERNYTVYLTGEGSLDIVRQYEDDLSVFGNGLAKVKFIHFSKEAPALLNIRSGPGNDVLINTLTRDVESKYLNVAAGDFSFKIYDFVKKNKIGDFGISDLKGGKIYTIYFTESSGADIGVHKVLHN